MVHGSKLRAVLRGKVLMLHLVRRRLDMVLVFRLHFRRQGMRLDAIAAVVADANETLEGVSGEKRVLIPRKALHELEQLLSVSDAAKVEFADDEHMLYFRVGHRTLSTRKLTGQFPNFEAVMPRDNTKFAVVRSSELAAAIGRVAQFADEH